MTPKEGKVETDPMTGYETLEDMLSIPLDLILPASTIGNKRKRGRGRRLMQKEAIVLLKVHLASCELDVLMSLATTLLMRNHHFITVINEATKLADSRYVEIVQAKDSPESDDDNEPLKQFDSQNNLNFASQSPDKVDKEKYKGGRGKANPISKEEQPTPFPLAIRAVMPLMTIHGTSTIKLQLKYVHSQIEQVLKRLKYLSQSLWGFAEQNLALSEQLYHDSESQDVLEVDEAVVINSASVKLAREKRFIGEIEDMLYHRINEVLNVLQSPNSDEDIFACAIDKETNRFVSMKKWCDELEISIFEDKSLDENGDDSILHSTPKNKRVKITEPTVDQITEEADENKSKFHDDGEAMDESPESPFHLTHSQVDAAAVLRNMNR